MSTFRIHFRIQEFAKLAGVTVRTLHHYDRLGLLTPAHRSTRGYRLYCHEDLGRLERILVLRYLGLPLREIGALLNTSVNRGTEPLTVTLARQRTALHERREGLDRVLRAIEHAQQCAQNDTAEPEWLLYQTILKEIHMQETIDWTEKYYSPKAIEVLRERRAAMTPEQMAEAGTRWQALYADIQSALDREVSPDSAEGRALVARWMRLGDDFTQGDPEIGEGFRRMYNDQSHWPDDEKAAKIRATMPKPEYWIFFRQAVQACLRHG
ncbi:MerR family transcriptional regulator [Silvibacterium sp.]|uniref:MerR family transcriptional regulator n=1 Tax=Silvibacterium sp. TaxID=1964179 RepID=UPI0039E5E79E